MKRTFDIVFSLCVLLCFLPFGVIIALLIKLSSKGPIFYACRRVGKGKKVFLCWKFRTMGTDADKKLQELLTDPQIKAQWDSFYKIKNDPRIHPFGRFLRKTSLDEFPQFWNVFKGDLSVVGPRPATVDEVKKHYSEKMAKILTVRPGLTGLWQTSGRSLLTFEERLDLEEKYIDQQSLSLDFRIICKTIPEIFFAKGAF